MRRRACLVSFFFLFFALVGQPWAGSQGKSKPTGGPSLVISNPTYEAGKVLEGSEIVHTFVLKNEGTKDLIIKNVKPG